MMTSLQSAIMIHSPSQTKIEPKRKADDDKLAVIIHINTATNERETTPSETILVSFRSTHSLTTQNPITKSTRRPS